MYQLTYISTCRTSPDNADVDDILRVSRLNNTKNGITGLLVYDGVRFLQALEGERALVEATFERIRRDARHRAAVILSGKEAPDRQFGEWAMASHIANAPAGAGTVSMPQLVDALVSGVKDRNARALFSGFARLDRKAS